MIRSLLRPAALPRSLPRTLPVARTVTTKAPTTSSGRPSTDIAGTVAPGEEIDPQLNGYPQLPYLSLQHREPFGWWDQQERKNFGEVVHEEEDALGMWSPDAHKIGGLTALFSILGAFTAVGAFGYFLSITRIERPVAARSYPYGGLEKELGGRNAARIEEDAMDDE